MTTATILRTLMALAAVQAAAPAFPAAAGPAKPEVGADPAPTQAVTPASTPAFTIDSVMLGPPGTPFDGVIVRIELLAAEARASLSGSSAAVTLDDDCQGGRVRIRRVEVYRGARQAGTPSEATAPPDWLPFASHSYAAQIAEAICGRREELTTAAAAVAPPVSPPVSPPASSPVPAPVQKPTPTPTPSPSPAPAAASAPAQTPAGGIRVQYLSTSSQAELERSEHRLRAHLGPDAARLAFTTDQAVVRGVTHFRGRIGPFATPAEARAFCDGVRRAGFACLPLVEGPRQGTGD